MTIDKNYFLARLANGEDMDTIGQDIADMMNEAVAEHEAIQKKELERAAAAEKAQARRAIVMKIVDATKEMATLEDLDLSDFEVSEEDLDTLTRGMLETFQMISQLKKLGRALETKTAPKAPKSDDEVLNDFIKSLLS